MSTPPAPKITRFPSLDRVVARLRDDFVSGGHDFVLLYAYTADEPPPNSSRELLTCKRKGVVATGYETTQGFVVKAGSTAVSTDQETNSFERHVPSVFKARREIIARGVLQPEGDHLVFTQDYTFNSPSLAAAIIIGGAANGRIEWKNSAGKTLKQLQESEAKASG